MIDRFDVVVVGGGAVGLCSAYELARRGKSVALLERGIPGREASWAGAGILPSFERSAIQSPHDVLRADTFAAFRRLADSLAKDTDIDIGLRSCGAIEIVFENDAAAHSALLRKYDREGVKHVSCSRTELSEIEPNLRCSADETSYLLPDVRQVRNPRLLKALTAGCEKQGVVLRTSSEVIDFRNRGELVDVICAPSTGSAAEQASVVSARDVVVTAGAWTTPLLQRIGISVPIYPIRGQIIALQSQIGKLKQVLHVGKMYLVPREDGVVLVGSTEEDVGYEKQTTESAKQMLLSFATTYAPHLAHAEILAFWAGLRPACRLDRPIIARLPDRPNLWIAAGHFREGLQLSPTTGKLIADWMTDSPALVPAESFPLTIQAES